MGSSATQAVDDLAKAIKGKDIKDGVHRIRLEVATRLRGGNNNNPLAQFLVALTPSAFSEWLYRHDQLMQAIKSFTTESELEVTAANTERMGSWWHANNNGILLKLLANSYGVAISVIDRNHTETWAPGDTLTVASSEEQHNALVLNLEKNHYQPTIVTPGGLPLTLSVPGDGDCLYTSVLYAMMAKGMIEPTDDYIAAYEEQLEKVCGEKPKVLVQAAILDAQNRGAEDELENLNYIATLDDIDDQWDVLAQIAKNNGPSAQQAKSTERPNMWYKPTKRRPVFTTPPHTIAACRA